jgi:general secretion pathway protein L
MSLLLLHLPPRPRLGARAAGEGAVAEAGASTVLAEFEFVFSYDGLAVTETGRAAPALLPRATRTVLMPDDADVGWHRIDVPKAPASRLRAALHGLLEEGLLDDDEALHFALGPGAQPGRNGWVAVMHRGWLGAALEALEAAGREVTQVMPASRPRDGREPQELPAGHFHERAPGGATRLVLEGADGVACVSLDGALARALLPPPEVAVRWTASPAAAAAAERFVGAPVAVLADAERALAACRGTLDLRQFDLAPRRRGTRALREAWRRFLGPAWRPVRLGLGLLVGVQLVGLNAWAWQQQHMLAAKRQAMEQVLRATYPGVRSVLDAPLQMQRETDRARALAGRPGEADYESMLGAAAAAWPDGAGPAPALRFEGARLTLTVGGWGEPQVRQFRDRLRGAGYAAEFAEGRVVVSQAKGR